MDVQRATGNGNTPHSKKQRGLERFNISRTEIVGHVEIPCKRCFLWRAEILNSLISRLRANQVIDVQGRAKAVEHMDSTSLISLYFELRRHYLYKMRLPS